MELAQASTDSNLDVIVAVVAAAGAVLSAVIAGLAAARSKRLEFEASRARGLYERVGESRESLYFSFIEMLRGALLEGRTGVGLEVSPDSIDAFSRFATWIQIYGSDQAVRTVHKFQQAAYGQAPPPVMIRYFAEMMLAARRDLGDENTKVELTELMGLLINDIYPDYSHTFEMPEAQLWQETGWRPPWFDMEGGTDLSVAATGGLSLVTRSRWRSEAARGGNVFASGGLALLTRGARWS